MQQALEALEAGQYASILMNTGGIIQNLRLALSEALAAPQPAKCWKCGDTDPAFLAVCDVPACEMREALAAANSVEFEKIKTEKRPPFGSKRKAAMAVYVPPFRFGHGYVYDSQNKMVADDHQVESAVASRVRGWGRLGYMPNGAELQDEIGQMIVDALNAYYAAQKKPVVEPVAHATVRPLQPDECERKVVVKWVNQPVAGPLFASPPPPATYQRIGTLYSNSWPMAASGWGFVPSGMACCMAGYNIEKAVFVQDEIK